MLWWGSAGESIIMCIRSAFPIVSVAVTALLWSAGVWAANGYFPNAWGPVSKGMAGAGIALDGVGPLAAANNPAAILTVADQELQLAVLLLHAMPAFDVSQPAAPCTSVQCLKPGRFEADPETPLDTAFIPQGGMNWRIGDRQAIALVVYANGGLNSTYEAFDNPGCPAVTEGKGVYCSGVASLDIAQFFIAPTYAMQVNPRWRLGISPILAIEAVEFRGLSAFKPLSSDPENLSNNGHDYALGFGFKFGTQVQATDTLSVGAVIQTKIDVGSFDDYAGIFPNGGQLDIPGYIAIGLGWQFLPRWTLAFDVQRIFYSEVAATGNEPDAPRRLGAEDGPGFGWQDSTIYKLGLRWQASEAWTWRAGYAHVEPLPVESDELFLNILAASVMQDQFAVGATWAYSGASAIDFSFIYTPPNEIRGRNPKFPSQTIEVSLGAYELDLSWRHRF